MIIPKEVRQKPVEYITLGIVFLFGLVIYFFAPLNVHSRRFVVYLLAGAYFLWSLIHHYRRGDLSLSIIVEYLVIALFGVALLTLSFF
jgi:hypothetical protein